MSSLLDPTDTQQIIERVNKLELSSKAEWGKMNVEQMLAHCQVPMRVAFGETKLKRGLIGMLFGKMAKKKMISANVFTRNLPTDPNFLIKRPVNFAEEKQKLISLIERFNQHPEQVSTAPHPFFGQLSLEEWDTLGWKHLDHHLRQFGV
jgi:hypothetical protein